MDNMGLDSATDALMLYSKAGFIELSSMRTDVKAGHDISWYFYFRWINFRKSFSHQMTHGGPMQRIDGWS